ncbi:DUF1365 domain-containing protein [Thalassotalea agarivorans]|uniref:DUF1365 domain-containing protein n=1 Tax=Thalassotalea agarivorans TaxID=349064 RepID=A0A1H9Y579_THASX|nr:DUF1365 domain-containing protein [Thalassotalea agarivorans]SES63854.1 hypothetical protein SAMN05660429_00074 [Thalassotalea agarivorans]
MTDLKVDSGIYQGLVFHKRYAPKLNSFKYSYYMAGVWLDEIKQKRSVLFGEQWYKPIRFNQNDYLKGEPGTLQQRIINKINTLGGQFRSGRIFAVAQCRHFGIYFSPINLFFCIQDDGKSYMLAEVSNTPWNKRHYYLVDMVEPKASQKTFHVSPFMDLNMKYHWKISLRDNQVIIGIDNVTDEKIFNASMALRQKPITDKQWFLSMLKVGVATLKVVILIYWQALKLLCKRVPFVPYQQAPRADEINKGNNDGKISY